MVINPLQLDNRNVQIATTTLGEAPDNYQSKVVLSNSTSVEFLALTTGITYFFRVLASNDISDSLLSSVSEAVPASSPLAPSFLSIEVSHASYIIVVISTILIIPICLLTFLIMSIIIIMIVIFVC
jgi:hypothetical protein